MMFPKDPGETIEVVYDFTDLVADLGFNDVSLVNPVVEVGRDSGDGRLVSVGGAIIAGLTVTQFYSGGTRSVTYEMACSATFSNGERRRIADYLLVS